ncbi:MAG: ACT domain-containing protein [Promethearchaeota archaeon]
MKFFATPKFREGKISTQITGDDKTSLIFSTNHKPGALYRALSVFSEKNINLTRLESMPSCKSPFEYFFILDFQGHMDNPLITQVLDELRNFTIYIEFIHPFSNLRLTVLFKLSQNRRYNLPDEFFIDSLLI